MFINKNNNTAPAEQRNVIPSLDTHRTGSLNVSANECETPESVQVKTTTITVFPKVSSAPLVGATADLTAQKDQKATFRAKLKILKHRHKTWDKKPKLDHLLCLLMRIQKCKGLL